jgi:hypothetical protein
MNRISALKQAQVIASLVEGNSIRATVRMTGVAKNTVVKLLAEIGTACEQYQNRVLRGLTRSRIVRAFLPEHSFASRSKTTRLHRIGHTVAFARKACFRNRLARMLREGAFEFSRDAFIKRIFIQGC